jgi:CDP-diacylglycerol---serine O-phosphatidyltransferase
MKKIHLLPNMITAFSLCCGLFVIFKMCLFDMGDTPYHSITAAAGILMVAAFADLLDGAIARAMNAQSEFGGFFDSLADSISFGVAPSVVILKTLHLAPKSELAFLLITAAMVYSTCGVLRLVRYSVTSIYQKDEESVIANKKNFTGLPIPAAAAAVISGALLLVSGDFHSLYPITDQGRAWVIFVMLIVIGYFMISRWKFPSLRTLRIRVASFQSVFLSALSAVFIFYGIFHHFALVFAFVSWLYIAIAWTLSIVRLISGKKSQTLVDFEPDSDDFDDLN